jgi:hypothetical protein
MLLICFQQVSVQFEHITSSNFSIILFQLARKRLPYGAPGVKRSKISPATRADASLMLDILNTHLVFYLASKYMGKLCQL